jgi:hypothetical protein
MRLNYGRKKSALPKVTALTVVVMGIIALLAPPYLLTAHEAFAAKSGNDDHHDKKHDDKKDDNGNETPPGYIAVDGELSELQLEVGPAPGIDPGEGAIADYEIDPQGTISFGERFSLLVPQASGVLKNAESAELLICFDADCANDDFLFSREIVDVNDEEFLYVETHVIDAPDELGDGFTANEEGFKIFMWWTVSFTDGTDQTYVAIVHLEGDPCEEHGWVDSSSGTRCFDPEE